MRNDDLYICLKARKYNKYIYYSTIGIHIYIIVNIIILGISLLRSQQHVISDTNMHTN